MCEPSLLLISIICLCPRLARFSDRPCSASFRASFSIRDQYSASHAIPAAGGNVVRYAAPLASTRIRAATFATVARLQAVAAWTCVQDMPLASMVAIAVLRALSSWRPV